jgi:hypothetical protein
MTASWKHDGTYGFYDRPIRGTRHDALDELLSLGHAMLVGCLIAGVIAGRAQANVATGALELFGTLACGLIVVGRTALRPLLVATLGPERVLLLGDGAQTDALVRALAGRRDVQATTLALPRDVARWWRQRAEIEAALAGKRPDEAALAAAGASVSWARELDGRIAIEAGVQRDAGEHDR